MLLLLKNILAPNLHQATCKLLFILNILVRMERATNTSVMTRKYLANLVSSS